MIKSLIFILSASLSLQSNAANSPVVNLPRTFSAASLSRQVYDGLNAQFAENELTVIDAFNEAYSLRSIPEQLGRQGNYPKDLVSTIEPSLVAFLVLAKQGFVDAAKIQMRQSFAKIDKWHDDQVRCRRFSDQEATKLEAELTRGTVELTLQRLGLLKRHESDRLYALFSQFIQFTNDESMTSEIENQTNTDRSKSNPDLLGTLGIFGSVFASIIITYILTRNQFDRNWIAESEFRSLFCLLTSVGTAASAGIIVGKWGIRSLKQSAQSQSCHPEWSKIGQSCEPLLSSKFGAP